MSITFEPKSLQRMRDIQNRYPSNTYGHCSAMADRITDATKAFHRYQAASHVFGLNSSESKCFLKRAAALGNPHAERILENQRIIKEFEMTQRKYESALKEENERKKEFEGSSTFQDLFIDA